MARTAINAVQMDDDGYNLTDSADFTALAVGAGNGVTFDYDTRNELILKNTTAGAATYTLKVPTPSEYAAKGATVPDVAVVVAAGKTWRYPLSGIFRQSDGKVYVDCDVAGSVLVLRK